jgi:formylglycine-generating enzyme required for sulfatase activity
MRILMMGILAANTAFAAETVDYKALYLQAKTQCETSQKTLAETDKQLVAAQSALNGAESELTVQNQALEKQKRIYDRATENAKETGDAVDGKVQQTYTAAVNAQKAAQNAVNQSKQALQQAQANQQQRAIDLQNAATQGKTATIDWLKAQFEIVKTQEVSEEVSCNDEQKRGECKDAALAAVKRKAVEQNTLNIIKSFSEANYESGKGFKLKENWSLQADGDIQRFDTLEENVTQRGHFYKIKAQVKAKVPADLWKEFWHCGTPAVEAVKVVEKSSGMSGMSGMSGGSKEPKQESKKTFTNSIGMEFVLIPAGSFQMGTDCIPKVSINCQENETPAHSVNIGKAFYMGKYEVTQAQWHKVMRTSPSHFNVEKVGSDTKNYPVENVSWNDAQAFVKRLNELEKCNDCYRLPTEAEWEYAAKAGTQSKWSFGDDENQLKDYAWFGEGTSGKTHPVGQKKPNAFGLFDMHGNVWEWTCSDYGKYSENKHLECSSKNDANKVLRGGSWFDDAEDCRSSYRYGVSNWGNSYGLGFRLALFLFPQDS